MKKFNLFKNNSAWLFSLTLVAITAFLVFFLSFILLILNVNYTLQVNSGNSGTGVDNIVFKNEVIVFPISVVLAVFEIIIAIYYCFNLPSWYMALSKSNGERKKLNSIYFYSISVLTVILLIDALIRFFYVIAYFNLYLSVNDEGFSISLINISKDSIFGSFNATQNLAYGNFGFNTIIALIISLVITILSCVVYLIQKKKYKSEQHENSKKDVQDFYRALEKDKIKKDLSKQKQKDFSKKITTF